MQPNPAWVNRSLTQFWGDLERLVGEDRMPLLTTLGAPVKGKRVEVEELGSGHYGTVMPTHTDGIVMKVTSDPTEAAFVAAALSIGEFPDGIVRYERIVALPEKLRGRGVFAIWREEAIDVGVEERSKAHPFDGKRYLDSEGMALITVFKEAAGLLRDQRDRAQPQDDSRAREAAQAIVSEAIDGPWYMADAEVREEVRTVASRGAFRSHVLYEILDYCFEMMENTHGVHEVGAALRFYFEHGILLADVHAQNIGRVQREDWSSPENVITDPGHAVFLDDRYDGVRVPELSVGRETVHEGQTALAVNARRRLAVGDTVALVGQEQTHRGVVEYYDAYKPRMVWVRWSLPGNPHSRHNPRDLVLLEEAAANPSRHESNGLAYAPSEDRHGHALHPGDRVRIKLYPRGTAEGSVVVSKRGLQVLPDGSTAPALAVDVEGTVYGMPPPGGVVKLASKNPMSQILSAAEAGTLPIGSIIFSWHGEGQGFSNPIIVVSPGMAVPTSILPERASASERESMQGEPIEQWGDRFALVAEGRGRLVTHGTAQRLLAESEMVALATPKRRV